MSIVACPYCNADNDVPDGFVSLSVTCSACGEDFVASTDASTVSDTTHSASRPHHAAPKPRPISAPKRLPPEPLRPTGEAIESSFRFVLKWFGILEGIALLFFIAYGLADTAFLFWIGVFFASLFPVWFMIWMMAYVRAIAMHTDR